MLGLGPTEMIVIGVLAVLLFGNRLPEVAKSVGNSFNQFKKGMQGIEEDVNTSSRASTSTASRSAARTIEDREEVSTPKFEPPPAEGAA